MRDNFVWTEPQPIGAPAAKAFPAEALGQVGHDMTLAVSEFTQTPPDAAGTAFLGAVAACVQGKYEVEGKPGYCEPVNVYENYVAFPGERKSSVHRCMAAHCYDWERLDNERRAPEIRRYCDENELYESEIISVKKSKSPRSEKSHKIAEIRAEQDLLKAVKPTRIFFDDITPESLATAMYENSERGAIFSAESGFFDNIGRYSEKANFDIFLKAHSVDPMRVNRRGREEIMNSPKLTILCCSQPHVIEGLMKNEAFRGRGLLARFLYSFPESALGQRRYDTAPIPPEVSRAYRDLIFALLDIPLPDMPKVIKLSDEAHKAHKHFFDIIEGEMTSKLAHVSDFSAKLPGAVLRIAGLLHIVSDYQSAQVNPISGDTMRNAVKLGYYFLSHALKTFAYTGIDEKTAAAQYAVKRLIKAPAFILSRSEIHALCRGRFEKVESLMPVLKNLVSLGYLREIPADRTATTGRRPDSRYELNPLYFGGERNV
ncbi:MAG: YfjI family protein [Christensenellales bacterium]|jgi:hypothetical protein